MAVVSVVLSAPQQTAKDARILNYESDNIGIDGYKFTVETSDGIHRQEEGSLKQIEDREAIVVRGSYSYIGDNGQPYYVEYIADENGFQPQGEHLPR